MACDGEVGASAARVVVELRVSVARGVTAGGGAGERGVGGASPVRLLLRLALARTADGEGAGRDDGGLAPSGAEEALEWEHLAAADGRELAQELETMGFSRAAAVRAALQTADVGGRATDEAGRRSQHATAPAAQGSAQEPHAVAAAQRMASAVEWLMAHAGAKWLDAPLASVPPATSTPSGWATSSGRRGGGRPGGGAGGSKR